ncbi:MAG: hypothetical protein VYD39_03435, partial [Bacteroidota bacterium]|nr:hypothetical protein [Bacteroidota bacterium]
MKTLFKINYLSWQMKTPAFYLKSQSRLVILILLSAIVALILWSLFRLVKQTEMDERQRMEVWA